MPVQISRTRVANNDPGYSTCGPGCTCGCRAGGCCGHGRIRKDHARSYPLFIKPHFPKIHPEYLMMGPYGNPPHLGGGNVIIGGVLPKDVIDSLQPVIKMKGKPYRYYKKRNVLGPFVAIDL